MDGLFIGNVPIIELEIDKSSTYYKIYQFVNQLAEPEN